MIEFMIGLVIGVFVGQELNVPSVKEYFTQLYNRYTREQPQD